MNNKERAMFAFGVQDYKKLEAEIIAAYRDKLLADVELPEPLAYEVNRAMCEPYLSYTEVKGSLGNTALYTKDQLQHCIAAARLQGRNEALEEAMCEVDAFAHDNVDLMTAIEALKGKS